MVRVFYGLAAAALAIGAAGEAMACPPRYTAEASAGFPWGLMVPLFIFVGVPALLFRMLAPSPLSFGERRKLYPLGLWTAVLSAFLALTLAFKERRAFLHRAREALRQKIQFEGLNEAWRAWAKNRPEMFHRVIRFSDVAALLAVAGMWVWTVADPAVTWGDGLEVPLTFTVDTVLVYLAARTFMRRVGFHLSLAALSGGPVLRGMRLAVRAVVMGSTAGLLGGMLFGLSSGVQTLALVPMARPDVMLLLPLWYGWNVMLMGALAALLMGIAIVLPYARKPQGFLPPG